MLHLWYAAPFQRASGKFTRKKMIVGLERCLAEGSRKVFKWLFTCLCNFFFPQNPDQWSMLIANKLNELRQFCFPANPFMLWCLFNEQSHSQIWQSSLLKMLRPHVQPWARKKKGCCSPKYRAHILGRWLGRVGCVVWGACKSHTTLGLGRACHSKGDPAWKRL